MRYSVSPCNNVFHGGQFFIFRMTLALQSLAERTSYRNLYHHLIKTKNFYPIFSFFCQMTNPDIRDYWEKSFYKKKKDVYHMFVGDIPGITFWIRWHLCTALCLWPGAVAIFSFVTDQRNRERKTKTNQVGWNWIVLHLLAFAFLGKVLSWEGRGRIWS